MKKLFVLFLFSALMFQTVCSATEKGSREGFSRLGTEKKIADGLGLTEEQRKEIFSNKSLMEKEITGLRKRIIELRNLTKSELRKDVPDRNILHNYIIEMNGAQSQIQIKRIDFLLKKRELLTEEQKEKHKRIFLGGEKEDTFFSPSGE